MKKLLAVFLSTAVALAFGCGEQHKSPPGGPGATGTQGKGTTGSTTGTADKDHTFTIKAPSGTTDIKQGQAKEISVSIDRGKDFKQNIKLSLTSDDKGVTVRPDTSELKASDNAAALKFNLEAAKDAAIGEHKVTVKATPETGPATDTTFNVKVTGP